MALRAERLPSRLDDAVGHRHQHVVPRLLLKRFAVDGHVEVRSRTRPAERLPIRAVAVRKNFYSYATAAEQNDTSLEHYLDRRVEASAGPAIARIVHGGTDHDDLDAAGRFATIQLVRSPRFRELDELAEEALGPLLAGMDAVNAYRAGQPPGAWDSDETQRIFDEAHRNPPSEYRVALDRNSRIRVLVRHANQLLDRAHDLTWSVAEASRPVFCLSDSPAVLFNPNLPVGGFGGFDVGPEDELRLPLSPQHLLLGVRRHLGPRRFSAPRDLVVSTNELLARECSDALFVAPGTLPLGNLTLAPTSPRLPTPTITLRPHDGPSTKPTFPQLTDAELRQIIAGTDPPN